MANSQLALMATENVHQASKLIRALLFSEMRDLRAGRSSPQQAIALAKLAAATVSTYRIELEARPHVPVIEGTNE